MTEQPLWLQSSPVQQLLNLLVDRMDSAEQRGSARTQSVALLERTWPALYKAQRESEKEELWGYAVELVRWGWLTVKPAGAISSPSGYADSPRVTVANEVEVRNAVGRAQRFKSAAERWREAVRNGIHGGPEVKAAVAEFCIDMPDRTMAEVVERLNELPAFAGKPMLLREVSSQLFWGMSKVLDKRQGLVAAVMGVDECPFPESPIQLQVFLPPAGCRGVLFIENLVSFERAIRSTSSAFDGLALVYASGFKGSAQRLRTPDGCSLFYAARGGITQNLREGFEAWLFGEDANPVFFWGDLDWSGMRILSAMRTSFLGLTAWEPGYSLMLAALMEGKGHTPEAADKKGQKVLGTSGCVYADAHLIPALQTHGRFIDQEQINP
ncbi:Wadjet anti-phage system protein JetD domain-containing protein [Massilia sp. SR12]